MTFTNGNLGGDAIRAEITIHAQNNVDQCRPPTPDNRACKLLARARVNELLGNGQFPYYSQDRDDESATWICFYTGSSGEVDLNLLRALKLTASEVRQTLRNRLNSSDRSRSTASATSPGSGLTPPTGRPTTSSSSPSPGRSGYSRFRRPTAARRSRSPNGSRASSTDRSDTGTNPASGRGLPPGDLAPPASRAFASGARSSLRRPCRSGRAPRSSTGS